MHVENEFPKYKILQRMNCFHDMSDLMVLTLGGGYFVIWRFFIREVTIICFDKVS